MFRDKSDMAGHSKFANIMHRKGAQDKRRAQMFTKLAREIQAAVRLSGADPAGNPRLARAMAAARAQSVPKDNIQRAIDRGSGAGGETLHEIRYEGFGPGGVGIIVECLTDNRNRSVGDVRTAFNRYEGALGETGSVSFQFDRMGEMRYGASVASEDAMLEAAIEAGADDCESDADGHVILCPYAALGRVSAALAKRFGDAATARIIWHPQTSVPVQGDTAQTVLKLVSALDELDDVQAVYANFDISEEDFAALNT